MLAVNFLDEEKLTVGMVLAVNFLYAIHKQKRSKSDSLIKKDPPM